MQKIYTVAGMAVGCAPALTPYVARLAKSSPGNFKPDQCNTGTIRAAIVRLRNLTIGSVHSPNTRRISSGEVSPDAMSEIALSASGIIPL